MINTLRIINIFICLAPFIIFSCKTEEGEPLPEGKKDTFWEVSDPASQQMDPAEIDNLESAVEEMDNVLSFLVIRNTKIVSENYFNGAKATSLLDIRSITKRVTSLLVGKAIEKGIIQNEQEYILKYFPEIDEFNSHPLWKEVTLYHLLNMLSGMDWNEFEDLNKYPLSDPLKFTFSQPIVDPPGSQFNYNTPCSHLLSYVIERNTPFGIDTFAVNNIAQPMGIESYQWTSDGNGVLYGGAGIDLTARDLAKFGLLMLQEGKWQDEQIISEQWVQETLEQPIELAEVNSSHGNAWGYRNFWYAGNLQEERIHFADGYGGQVLLIAPDYELIIVMNRKYEVDMNTNFEAFREFFNEILPQVFESVDE